MKRILIALCALAVLSSCGKEDSRIVSDKSIDASVMGCTLNHDYSENALRNAYETAYGKSVSVEHRYSEAIELVRASLDSDIVFAGFPWKYEDVYMDAGGKVYSIMFDNTFATRKGAEAQYEALVNFFKPAYGEANHSKSRKTETSMWTDDTNSMGVCFYKDKGSDEKDKWLCVLYYVNIELSGAR